MKLGGLDHPKVLDFASRLHISRAQAIGHLELLWAYCALKTPQGNVGKWPDGSLAMSCDWTGEASDFVAALVDSGLLDRDPKHRLLVHDWQEHAPSWVRANLGKAKLTFFARTAPSSSERSSEASSEATSEATREASSRARVSMPCHAMSCHAKADGDKERASDSDERRAKEGDQTLELSEREQHQQFLKFQAAYPKRSGRTDWVTAEHHYRIRIAEKDATHEELLDVAIRCAKYYEHTGEIGSKYVISPITFLSGPDRPWLQAWELPTDTQPKKNGNGNNAPELVTHEQREARDLQSLKERRSKIALLKDFRDPKAGETASEYRAAQDAEWDRRREQQLGEFRRGELRGALPS